MLLNNSILTAASNEAKKSDHKFKMGAIIFHKKSYISRGHNYSCRSVKHLHPKFFKWPYSVHAEVDAIIKARTDVAGMSLLIVRLNKQENLVYSYPCERCMSYIYHVNLKNLYYVNKTGNIVREKL